MAGQDLASVLSSLQRASGLSLRTLANRTGLSASYLCRLMSGERFPAWKNVAVLARACGADPGVLRRAWKASSARRDASPGPPHSPPPCATCISARAAPPPGPSPSPAATNSTKTTSPPCSTARPPVTGKRFDASSSSWTANPPTRVEELLAAFKGALGSPGLTPSSPARRCLATPIPIATHWSTR
ncbi:helix-turn-helix transcriptional regulator [Streptomyces sp. NPDC019990]|uniref:helix-turn-helix domain-containing protein n=1 Tax=Streptomyces sp. NPDC019990 TaxID=3154693 RepID=UPI0033EF44F0